MSDIQDYRGQSPAYEELGPTRPSTSSERPVPPKIGRIIGELGLRYRPSAQADLEAHAEALALLAKDVAHLVPEALESATRRWVRESRFMPKAAELIAICQQMRKPTAAQETCDHLNAYLRGEVPGVKGEFIDHKRSDVHWVVRNGKPEIEWKHRA
jgi:hypothetical protein